MDGLLEIAINIFASIPGRRASIIVGLVLIGLLLYAFL
jgi:hypothetical protein